MNALLAIPKPDHMCREPAVRGPHIAADCMLLERIDWDNLSLEDLKHLDDVAYFLTDQAMCYILPRILVLVEVEGISALECEFVDSIIYSAANAQAGFTSSIGQTQRSLLFSKFCEVLETYFEDEHISWASDWASAEKGLLVGLSIEPPLAADRDSTA